MIELMLIACLLSEPQRCQQHFVPTEASLSMMECIVSGQIRLAQWHQEHPGWFIHRWVCGLPQA
jgi:hypothetical protein